MSRPSADASNEADMTPMIDAVFLLIIFFLCIEFRTLEAKLPAYLPKDIGANAPNAHPEEQLSLKIHCVEYGREVQDRPGSKRIRLEGHVVEYSLGPRRFTSLAALKRELTAIAEDPTRRVPDPNNAGERKMLPIIIEPEKGSTYGDVAAVVDAVNAAGFEEVNFGGGRGKKR